MRFLTLDLERYGPFTATRLSFRPDAKVHVVVGANEAGKSSALAAITDLLFGFEARTTYDFLHKQPDLRVGAQIVGQNGAHLSFRRRKRTKGTLLDGQDATLPDDLLTPHLGGLTREVFTRAFGLNAETLRKGAQEIVASQGEAGASLLAAAAGLRHLSALRGQIDKEAAEIFAPRHAQNRTFYQAYDRYEAARAHIRDTELKAPDWAQLNTDIAAATAALATQDTQRKALAAQRRRLERLQRVAPLLRELDTVRADLSGHAHLPNVSPDALAALQAAHGDHATALKAATQTAEAHAATQAESAAIAVDTIWLQHAADIERLVQLVGSYQAAGRDCPRVQAEVDSYIARLRQHAVALGLTGPTALETQQPTAAAQALVAELTRTGRGLQAEALAHRKALDSAQDELATLRQDKAQTDALIDPTALREQTQALLPLQLEHARHTDLAHTVAVETQALREATARLYPPVADLSAMARAPLPAASAIASARQHVEAARKALDLEESKRNATFDAEDQARARLAQLRAGRDVPSAARIAEVRTSRDGLWGRLRGHVLGAAPVTAAELPGVVSDFDRQLHLADQLVDEAARDAERVAAFDMAQADLAERIRVREAADQASERAAQAHNDALVDWEALWAPCGIVPQNPDAMADWLKTLGSLLERRSKLDEAAVRLDALAAKLGPATATVANLLHQAGLPEVAGLDLGAMLTRLNQRVSQLEEQWSGARSLQAQIEALEARCAKLGSDVSQSMQDMAAWRAQFSPAIQALGLTGTETIDQAEAAAREWQAVPETLSQREDRARRVAGMQRSLTHFETQARDLVEKLAPDLAAMAPDAAAAQLLERLTLVRDQATRKRALDAQAVRHGEMASQARQTHQRVERQLLEALITQALIAPDTPADLALATAPATLAHLQACHRMQAEERRLLAELRRSDDGVSEADLRADLQATDLDAAAGELQALTTAEERLQTETNETFAQRQGLLTRRTQLEGGVGAELAVQERLNAEAELRAAARDYAVLRAAHLLLGAALERHRASRQDPLMQRAGALLTQLTLGAWTGLDQALDEGDTMRLQVRRADGELLDVAKPVLSEGTRDQLYLALRLAYLESYAARSPAAPFIGDDLFASFDEARTAQGLQALAAISGAVQPIIFTHHQHVGAIARATLGPDADVVQLGV